MKRSIGLALLIAAIAGPIEASEFLSFTSIELRIGGWDDEATITRENLMEIRAFIFDRGYRETYGNQYNDNPAHRTDSYRFYLSPDTGQNAACDPAVCGFHHLFITRESRGWDARRAVDFRSEGVVLSTNVVREDLSVGQLHLYVADAMQEILAEIDEQRTTTSAGPQSMEVVIRLGRQDPRWDDGTILRHENLLRIHHLLRDQGRQDQPGFLFSLDPDAAGSRRDSESHESDESASYHLTIRAATDRMPEIHVDFSDHRQILLRVNDPTDDLAAGEIVQFVVDAMAEILTEPAGTG